MDSAAKGALQDRAVNSMYIHSLLGHIAEDNCMRLCTKVRVGDLRNYKPRDRHNLEDYVLDYVFCDLCYHAYVALYIVPDPDNTEITRDAWNERYRELKEFLDSMGVSLLGMEQEKIEEAIPQIEDVIASQLKKYS